MDGHRDGARRRWVERPDEFGGAVRVDDPPDPRQRVAGLQPADSGGELMTEPNVMRAPVVGAVGGGVGATVLAALLECPEAGVVAGDGSQPVDVLVCRSTAHSVRDAIAVAARMGAAPVLAMVADCSHSPPSAVRHRLRMAGPNLTGIVAVPWWDWLRETLLFVILATRPAGLRSLVALRSGTRRG